MKKAQTLKKTDESRILRPLQRRVSLDLTGRFMSDNKKEFPCRTKELSLDDMELLTLAQVKKGERVVTYIEELGRIEGTVREIFSNSFTMNINSTPHKREKLAAQLTWLMNREELGMDDERKETRQQPSKELNIHMKLENGEVHACRLIDLSVSSAAFNTDVRPSIGSCVSLGKMKAYVLRHFEKGIAVEFAKIQEPPLLYEGNQENQKKEAIS
ncbi:MAG: PilZ domain-containing protein [Alphaproteobacteria bacterium]|nr:PilZ domain-containing protein [Alphaproteobacteria bacterium]